MHTNNRINPLITVRMKIAPPTRFSRFFCLPIFFTEYVSTLINKLQVITNRRDGELKRVLLFGATIIIGIILGIIVTNIMM